MCLWWRRFWAGLRARAFNRYKRSVYKITGSEICYPKIRAKAIPLGKGGYEKDSGKPSF